jgi:hypothetical protein
MAIIMRRRSPTEVLRAGLRKHAERYVRPIAYQRYVYLGGESHAINCLKIIARGYVRIHEQKNPLSGKVATYRNPCRGMSTSKRDLIGKAMI